MASDTTARRRQKTIQSSSRSDNNARLPLSTHQLPTGAFGWLPDDDAPAVVIIVFSSTPFRGVLISEVGRFVGVSVTCKLVVVGTWRGLPEEDGDDVEMIAGRPD